MGLVKLFFNYLWSLIKHWVPAVFLVGDTIWVLTVAIGKFELPSWVYFVVFGVEFVIANFVLYYKNQLEFLKFKEEAQREIEGLKNEILDLKDRIPKLGLSFKVGDACVQKQTITVKDKPAQVDFDRLVKEEQDRIADIYKSHLSQMVESSSDPDKMLIDIVKMSMNLPKRREIYETECREYIEAYRSYLRSKFHYDFGQARYRTVEFVVENYGKTPGEEIVLIIHFPDVFHFFAEEDDDAEKVLVFDYLAPPEKPASPKVTEFVADLMQRVSSASSFMSSPIIDRDVSPQSTRGPFITRTKSTEIRYEIDELLHNFIQDEDELGFVVLDEAIGKTWEIKYTIHAANLPVPVEGSLRIKVVKE